MPSTKNTFKKTERLCGEIRIARLFAEGNAFIAYPLRIVYLKSNKTPDPLQVVISVPKKRFKRAIKRNLLRRRMKEAYRFHKNELYEKLNEKDYSLHLGITYISNEELSFAQIEKKMHDALQKIKTVLE